jgi:hypothetical protein
MLLASGVYPAPAPAADPAAASSGGGGGGDEYGPYGGDDTATAAAVPARRSAGPGALPHNGAGYDEGDYGGYGGDGGGDDYGADPLDQRLTPHGSRARLAYD